MQQAESCYKVHWILTPDDPQERGLLGTTSHYGTTPAAAAIECGFKVVKAAGLSKADRTLVILAVSSEDDERDLLHDGALDEKLRLYRLQLPCTMVHRPPC